MEQNGLNVVLIEKMASGELRKIEERIWSQNMIVALEHVNYIVAGGIEYETIEGRLNVDSGNLELMVVTMKL